MAKILLVDRNQAFATMLKEMLEMDGTHVVRVASRGRSGINLLQRESFDLTIVDVEQEPGDIDYATLIKAVRRLYPRMPVVLIPLMGEAVPAEAHRLNIQGALSKPFFVDDLLPRIEDALSRQVEPASGGQLPPQAPARVQAAPVRAESVLSELARETQADVVLLASMAGGHAQVLEHVSTLEEDRIRQFAELVVAAAKASQAAACFLGQPDEPYRHNMFESDDSRLYLMALPSQLLVAVVTPIHTPLGTIRHNLRRASRAIAGVE
jgi:CheY-like chemotaxis protein/predicted regulator of Ras-like GTPase activity (Roadblock/LC7/MglB family)